MKDMGIVHGNGEQAKAVIVGVDTVYVHTDIQKVETDHNGKAVEDLFSYHEVQYSKRRILGFDDEGKRSLEGKHHRHANCVV